MKKTFWIFLLFVTISGTIFCSQNWVVTYAGQPNGLKGIHFINSSTGFIVGNGVFLKTTNGGGNWVVNSSRFDLKSVYFLDNQTGFVAGKSNDSGFVLKTTNSGINWTNYYLGALSDEYGNIFFKDNNTGYIVKPNYGYYRSTNSGLFWVFNSYIYNSIQDFKWIGNLFYKIGSTGSGYQKPAYWTSPDEVDWGAPFYCEECENEEYGVSVSIYDTVSYFVTKQYGGFRLRRKSISNPIYQIIENGSTTYYFNNSAYIHFGFASNSKSYIYSSSNSGYNWVRDTVADFSIRNMFFINLNTGFAVGDNGLIAKTTNGGGTIGIETISTEIPNSFSLSQNYPNPFNPVTVIKFSIVSKGNVKLIIFDALGREVTTLLNQDLKPGSYKTDWDASNNPSGIYFYKLETSNFTQTKKMVLIK